MAINQTIELHIEKLVLKGFPPSQRQHIQAAVQAELTRLFTEKGVPSSFSTGKNIRYINGGAFNSKQGEKGETTGNSIARSLYKNLAK
ncbi:hypothetical protein [Mucilaginibacter agri]|uniref:Uncharacterized protein n=1 Tax=Mucilaginibacter agri TaxID=2695265 RepID=A0A965ZIH7_9SPHI|nr:hypothetical protein [Mucilaginibacter agri]NCD71685.1 hypothetical protein [Mucilaginibacter agri]